MTDKNKNNTPDPNAAGQTDGQGAATTLNNAAASAGDAIHNLFSSTGTKTAPTTTGAGAKPEDKPEADELNPDGTKKTFWDKICGWFKSINAGGVIGAVGGIFGSSLITGMFGEGIVGKIAKWLLMPAMALIGWKMGDEHINPWLHPDQNKAGAAPAPVLANATTHTNTTTQPQTQPAQPAPAGNGPLTPEQQAEAQMIYETYQNTYRQFGSPMQVADVRGLPNGNGLTYNRVSQVSIGKTI